MTKTAVILIPITIIAIALTIFLFAKYTPETPTSSQEKIEFNPKTPPAHKTEEGWTRGKDDAKLHLIEFANFSCPACASYSPFITQLLKDIPELKITYKHFPFTYHKNDIIAALAAEAAGEQGKFAEMAELLYTRQNEWVNAKDETIFARYGEALNLEIEKFKKDLKNPELRLRIDKDLTEAQQRNLEGTPTFFLNGEKIELPLNLEEASKILLSRLK